MRKMILGVILSSGAALFASCGMAQPADKPAQNSDSAKAAGPFRITPMGSFDAPWAARFAPGTTTLFITEKKGTLKFVDVATGRSGTVSGTPAVNSTGQGGFADIAFLPQQRSAGLTGRTIYLSWAEAGDGPRSGVVGRGTLACGPSDSCRIEGLQIIWRQSPKVQGPLQYALRMAFSPDGKYLFVSSGDRVAIENVQQLGTSLGKIVRLTPDGRPAPGNPFAAKGSPANEIWTYGHRNPLGLQFDQSGALFDLEHGPRGGDEINRLEPGKNYGWPLVSGGDNYNGTPIPRNETRPDLAQPAIMWNPVIAPGDFLFYSGKLWPQWKNQALIAGLGSQAIVRVSVAGSKASEQARYPMGKRIRELVEAPNGSLYALEDGGGGRLLHLTPN